MNTAALRYFLGKDSRLKSRKAIDALFASGRSFHVYPVKMTWQAEPGSGKIQAGVSVSKKRFKKSVDRNRVKRLLREAYRMEQHALTDAVKDSGKDVRLFFHYTGNELPELAGLRVAVQSAIRKLIKMLDARS